MTPQQLEALVLDSIDRLRAGESIEDDRVELKREWPDPVAKARQLAGAVNKANGDEVVYIIGADEKTGLIHDHSGTDVASWWAQISARFDDVSPDLVRHINVTVSQGEAVTALVFSSDRAPYMVKVGDEGSAERDVPYRDGTRTRTIKRAELLRLLIPQATVPPVLLLTASMDADLYSFPPPREKFLRLSGHATIFVEHTSSTSIFMPLHDSFASLSSGDISAKPKLSLRQPPKDSAPPVFGVHSRSDGVVATGPGQFTCYFVADAPTDLLAPVEATDRWTLNLSFAVAGTTRRVDVRGELDRIVAVLFNSEMQRRIGKWGLDDSMALEPGP